MKRERLVFRHPAPGLTATVSEELFMGEAKSSRMIRTLVVPERMLQTYSPSRAGAYEDRESSFDLARYIAIAKRRVFYFAVPFVLLLVMGVLVVAIQRPIYRAEGKILVESPEIPTNLVQPTVTAAATERIQVIQQRIMSRDNLLAIVKKFGLFASEQQRMSGTQILDLMRQRAQIQLVDVNIGNLPGLRPTNAIAFTISFEYETPDLATKVANEFLTLILDEDVRARTSHAAETTEFLAQEVKRLQEKLDTVYGQISEIKRQAAASGSGSNQDVPDELKSQITALAEMKTDLIQKSSIYSSEHPVIKSLKQRIAAQEQEVARETKAHSSPHPVNQNIDVLEQQEESLEKELDEATKKLTTARLGESMERNQQSEHLQVLEQPTLPQKPVKPNRFKLLAISVVLAGLGGLGIVFLTETLDRSIRNVKDLVGVVDGQLIVAIPYISTVEELRSKRRTAVLLWAALTAVLLIGFSIAAYLLVEIDFSWFDRSWIDSLTRLSK